MPNGIEKNWFRMCAAIDGFRARYVSWPTKIHLFEGALDDLFKEETLHTVEQKIDLIYDGLPYVAEDEQGRCYNYAEDGFSAEPPDIPAYEWLDVEPDSKAVQEYRAPRRKPSSSQKAIRSWRSCSNIFLLFFVGLLVLMTIIEKVKNNLESNQHVSCRIRS
jgi:hypothetical protein